MNGLPSIRGARGVLGHGRLLVILVGTVVFTTLAGAAFGYWGTTGSGVGSASTGTLNAPTRVTANSTAGSGSVSVNWSAPTGTLGAQGYLVTRTGNGTSTAACGTSASMLKATSCTDSSVPDGTYNYTVTAVYNSWTATSAASQSVSVSNTIATTTTLTSSANPSVVGQQVTYTASVTPASGSTSASGAVTFKDASSTITCTGGNQTLAAGSATCSVAYTTVGTHSITATYAGGGGFGGSTSSALSQSVGAAGTTTGLTASPNPSTTNQTVTFTATVTVASPGAGTPTGAVAFTAGGNALTCSGGNQTLNGAGTATCQVTFSTAGTRTITATYSGDTNYRTSSAALAQSVNTASLPSTTTKLVSSQNPAKSGTQVTYSATVSPTSGSGTPTGTVTFKDSNTVMVCEAGSSQTITAGVATCKMTYPSSSPSTSLGSHSITATYSGDATYATSTGDLAQRIVNGNVTGVNFANVAVNGSPTSPTCSGVGTNAVNCTITGTANSASVVADVVFVGSSGAATVYATDSKTSVGWNGTSKNTPLTGTLDVAAGETTSSTRAANAVRNGSNSATLTYTFTDAGTTYTATLTLN